MITLKNVSKTYKSKKGKTFQALKNISLTLPNNGMVFLLGKSGSGKSTLLNIIGGLDQATSGEIEIDDKKFMNFTENEMDIYRKKYIGFIFQEYNLLDNFTVFDNLDIALQFQDEKNNKSAIKRALTQVGLEDFEKRFPAELSGGEKQRIAIARAIVKQSQIILADEPTGNLDSQTGEDVLRILQTLSKEKLVIVVTHDKEFADRYADKIINIKDGEIISDSGKKQISSEKFTLNNFKPRGLRVKSSLKLALHNLGLKKVKTSITVFVSVIAITILCLAYVFNAFTPEKAISATAKSNNTEVLRLFNNGVDFPVGAPQSDRLNANLYRLLDNKYQDVKYMKSYSHQYLTNIISTKADMLDFGFSFFDGALGITDNSIYVTDMWMENCYQVGVIQINGQNIPIDKTIHSYSFVIDKTVNINPHSNDYFKIAGIVKTNYRDFYDENLNILKEMPDKFSDEKKYLEEKRIFITYLSNSIFCTETFFNDFLFARQKDHTSVNLSTINSLQVVLNNNQSSTFSSIYFGNNKGINNNQNVINDVNISIMNEIDLEPNEVIVSLTIYNKLFGYNGKISDYFNGQTIIKFPDKIGEEINLSIIQTELGDVALCKEKLRIAGVILKEASDGGDQYKDYMFFSDHDYYDFMQFGQINDYCTLKIDNVSKEKIAAILKGIREFNICVDFSYAQPIYLNEQAQKLTSTAFMLIGIFMAVLSFLLTVNLISYNIISQKKKIGILRSLGARNIDILSIFMLEALILALCILLLSILGTSVIIAIVNFNMQKTTMMGITYLQIEFFAYFLMCLSSIILISFATLFPIRKIIKMKPIDAIKDL